MENISFFSDRTNGVLGWLDDASSKIGEYAGRGVDIILDQWERDIAQRENNGVVAVVDPTPVQPPNPLGGKTFLGDDYIKKYNIYFVVGGLAFLTLLTIHLSSKKG